MNIMKNSILPVLAIFLICSCSGPNKNTDSNGSEMEAKEYDHDQETRNLRNPENMPGLDYTATDSLEEYQKENLNIEDRLSDDFKVNLSKNDNFKNKQIERVDSVKVGSEYEFRINFRGDTKNYRFDRYGNLISG
jgi:hypothetical protein